MATRTSAGSRFTRPIDPIERWYLGCPKSMSPVQNLLVEGTGRVDAEELG